MEITADQLKSNYLDIYNRIEKACARAKRTDRPNIIAVSKTKPVWMIETLYQFGVRNFGENYVQELQQKKESLGHHQDLSFHFIGHLQKNKVKSLLRFSRRIHSVDSFSLLVEIEKRLRNEAFGEAGEAQIFLQVNLDEEPTKSGFLISDVPQLVDQIKAHDFSHIRFKGWMCIPDPRKSPRRSFELLGELRSRYPELGRGLSMGMSEDFELAAELGSTELRIGSALFGAR